MTTLDNDYPEKMARGITRSECVDGRNIRHCVFSFDKDMRDDGQRELSVTWLDNQKALDIVRTQKRVGSADAQFKLGIAVLERSKVDKMARLAEFKGLGYERKPSRSNPYHGNLLIPGDTLIAERELASRLALESEYHELGEMIIID